MLIKRHIGWNVNLCVGTTPLSPAFATFQIVAPSLLHIEALIGLKHRGNYPVGVGWGLRAGLRYATTEQGLQVPVSVNTNMPTWIKGAKSGGNILRDVAIPNLDQHYEPAVLIGHPDPAAPLQPGWYRVEIWGNCHGASSGPVLGVNDSVVEVNADGGSADPYNSILYTVTPA